MNVCALVPAAGRSQRLPGYIEKPFMNLVDKPILAHTLLALENSELITSVTVVASESNIEYCRKEVVEKCKIKRVSQIVAGGWTRQESVYKGVLSIDEGTELVVVHDGVRPFLSRDTLEECIRIASLEGAAIVAVPVKSTVKEISGGNSVRRTLKREDLWEVQTPQVFRRDLLIEAHRKAQEDGFKATDDAALVEKLGVKVRVVMGSYENIKITTPEDLIMAEIILTRRAKPAYT